MTQLTPREVDVVRGLARGLTNKEIANEFSISENVVKFHVLNVMKKFKASTRTKAAVLFTLERLDEVKEMYGSR